MLELVVRRVFTRHRRAGVNMRQDTTVGEGEVCVSLNSHFISALFLLTVFVLDVSVILGKDVSQGNPGMKEDGGGTILELAVDESDCFFLM